MQNGGRAALSRADNLKIKNEVGFKAAILHFAFCILHFPL